MGHRSGDHGALRTLGEFAVTGRVRDVEIPGSDIDFFADELVRNAVDFKVEGVLESAFAEIQEFQDPSARHVCAKTACCDGTDEGVFEEVTAEWVHPLGEVAGSPGAPEGEFMLAFWAKSWLVGVLSCHDLVGTKADAAFFQHVDHFGKSSHLGPPTLAVGVHCGCCCRAVMGLDGFQGFSMTGGIESARLVQQLEKRHVFSVNFTNRMGEHGQNAV